MFVQLSSCLQRFTPCSTPSSLPTLISASTRTWAKTSPWTITGWRSSTCCRLRASVIWRGTRRSWRRSLASSTERKALSRGWLSGPGSGLTRITVCPFGPRSSRNPTQAFFTSHGNSSHNLNRLEYAMLLCLACHSFWLLDCGSEEHCVNTHTTCQTLPSSSLMLHTSGCYCGWQHSTLLGKYVKSSLWSFQ